MLSLQPSWTFGFLHPWRARCHSSATSRTTIVTSADRKGQLDQTIRGCVPPRVARHRSRRPTALEPTAVRPLSRDGDSASRTAPRVALAQYRDFQADVSSPPILRTRTPNLALLPPIAHLAPAHRLTRTRAVPVACLLTYMDRNRVGGAREARRRLHADDDQRVPPRAKCLHLRLHDRTQSTSPTTRILRTPDVYPPGHGVFQYAFRPGVWGCSPCFVAASLARGHGEAGRLSASARRAQLAAQVPTTTTANLLPVSASRAPEFAQRRPGNDAIECSSSPVPSACAHRARLRAYTALAASARQVYPALHWSHRGLDVPPPIHMRTSLVRALRVLIDGSPNRLTMPRHSARNPTPEADSVSACQVGKSCTLLVSPRPRTQLLAVFAVRAGPDSPPPYISRAPPLARTLSHIRLQLCVLHPPQRMSNLFHVRRHISSAARACVPRYCWCGWVCHQRRSCRRSPARVRIDLESRRAAPYIACTTAGSNTAGARPYLHYSHPPPGVQTHSPSAVQACVPRYCGYNWGGYPRCSYRRLPAYVFGLHSSRALSSELRRALIVT
ncbi:hypothetical protein DFH09DRAFT_1372476 [Mycena vulgaris]|nr:hypothetical protein DFH09DRAFT_1372476 [Mycena vulgaris]